MLFSTMSFSIRPLGVTKVRIYSVLICPSRHGVANNIPKVG